jgi:hypothetical protein
VKLLQCRTEPFGPPPEVRGNLNNEQQRELAGLFNAPKVVHKIRLTNTLRYLLGAADSAEADGKVEKMNMFENGDYLASGDYPYWWSWYGWPYWWNSFNGIGRITWDLTLDPDQSKELGYQWHYFWR